MPVTKFKKMKIYIYILVLLSISCKAQYSLQNYDSANDLPSGSYCADTFNDFNNYEGTWKSVVGNKEFTIILQKRTHIYYDFEDIYTDFLVGEYKYKENNVEIINTTSNLNTTISLGNNITGNLFIQDNNDFPICDDCIPNERRVQLFFTDPTRTHVHALIVLRYKVENGVQVIKATLYETLSITVEGDNLPEHITVPVGVYTLIKQ
tara:strand:+ start:1473 stop:2093 length:621 start_codon:yes stop_codon:yes gene_type:complete